MNEAVGASPLVLKALGYDAAVIRALRSLGRCQRFLTKEGVSGRELPMSEGVLKEYLRAHIAFQRNEHFHVLYLDGCSHLIDGRTHWEGSVDKVAIHIREIVFTAVVCGARSLILAHNHPSGLLQPSQEDILLTRQMCQATAHLDLSVLDHWIVGPGGAISLRAMGLMGQG
jgi:DNA repair protein RadC